jgi:uracil phosphoribosyltransferase
MVHNLSSEDSLVAQYMAEIRDINIQYDRTRFRTNLERIAQIAAYQLSKSLEWTDKKIHTPLAETTVRVLKEQPLIANILRAGLPMHNGLLHFFDKADNAFISAYRKHDEQGDFVIELEYLSCPPINDRVLIITDPMLATGSSMILTLKALYKLGLPKKTHIVCAIASKEGIMRVTEALPGVSIWTGDVDNELNDKAYIVPGLGDAGDLAFGDKMQE